jgi:LAO/AO transport system kinase
VAQDWIERLVSGDRSILSKLITLVERRDERIPEILDQLPDHSETYCIGITGPPGAGKSTLIDGLTVSARTEKLKVAIVAIDPTSTFSGGAILGDRIRMQRHVLDEGVYIRSMATKGIKGGLSSSVGQVIRLLNAANTGIVIVETVGVGQSELDITTVADTTVVVLVPEAGDSVQSLKAGITEIGDIFVVNKSDREGAHFQEIALKSMVAMGKRKSEWQIPIIRTQADQGKGISEVYQAIGKHRTFLEASSSFEKRRRDKRRREFFILIEDILRTRLAKMSKESGLLAKLSEQVESNNLDPLTAAQRVLSDKSFLLSIGEDPD